jgi:hypothetical protein
VVTFLVFAARGIARGGGEAAARWPRRSAARGSRCGPDRMSPRSGRRKGQSVQFANGNRRNLHKTKGGVSVQSVHSWGVPFPLQRSFPWELLPQPLWCRFLATRLPVAFLILRASLPANPTARHIYQLATVRHGRQRSPNFSSSFGLGMRRLRYVSANPFCTP